MMLMTSRNLFKMFSQLQCKCRLLNLILLNAGKLIGQLVLKLDSEGMRS